MVIHAQPFGTTEVTVFDTDFLAAPEGPVPELPDEPPVPAWVAVSSEEPQPLTPPVIFPLELLS